MSISRILKIGGHSKEKHFGISDSEMIKRIIHENKSVSSFEDKEEGLEFIIHGLVNSSKDIYAWLTEDKNLLDNYYRLNLSIDMGEVVGKGYTTSFLEKETNILSMIIERDNASDIKSPLGFHIVSAYPDINHEKSICTGKRYDIETAMEEGFKNILSNIEKVYIELRNQGLRVKYDSKEEIITIKDKIDNTNMVSYLCANGQIDVKTLNLETKERRRLDYSSLVLEYPNIAKRNSDIMNYIEQQAQCKSQTKSQTKQIYNQR